MKATKVNVFILKNYLPDLRGEISPASERK